LDLFLSAIDHFGARLTELIRIGLSLARNPEQPLNQRWGSLPGNSQLFSSRLHAASLRLNPIAVVNQIVGGLLDLIRRQLRFASCGGHIVHRWKGVIRSTAG
jgi:hypothetical protein